MEEDQSLIGYNSKPEEELLGKNGIMRKKFNRSATGTAEELCMWFMCSCMPTETEGLCCDEK